MAKDFTKETLQESAQRDAAHRWIQARVEAIRKAVTVQDVLGRHGVILRGHGDREEQISCPFHGRDNKPSCRVYPETPRGPSHAWCFVCQERWDAINLWKKFTGETKFTRVLGEIERAYGLLPPERPPEEVDDSLDPEIVELDMLFDVCERRLRAARDAFDMRGYLTLGSILDRLAHAVDSGSTKPSVAKPVLQRVLDKIGAKVRACPDV
jgi:hypothetical protein